MHSRVVTTRRKVLKGSILGDLFMCIRIHKLPSIGPKVLRLNYLLLPRSIMDNYASTFEVGSRGLPWRTRNPAL